MPQGTARPEEVLSLVGLAGLIADGVPLERVGLELKARDEQPTSSPARDTATGALLRALRSASRLYGPAHEDRPRRLDAAARVKSPSARSPVK